MRKSKRKDGRPSTYRFAQCVDCGERRRVKNQDWYRAAPPRCYGCGGRLEISDPGLEGTTANEVAAREKRKSAKKKQGF